MSKKVVPEKVPVCVVCGFPTEVDEELLDD
jgi:hypothetical protein